MGNGYNGWRNWETWNVALWVQNDEGLQRIARRVRNHKRPYWSLVGTLEGLGATATPDGAAYRQSPDILDIKALNDMIREL
jgi:hypothetical protein